MTQAILYGSNLDVGRLCVSSFLAAETSPFQNPLNFSFPPEVDGNSLMTGAEQLSKAILESGNPLQHPPFELTPVLTYPLDSEIIRPNHDLNAHMMGRKDKLIFLIKFINDNAALSKVGVVVPYWTCRLAETSADVSIEPSETVYGCRKTSCRSSSVVEA